LTVRPLFFIIGEQTGTMTTPSAQDEALRHRRYLIVALGLFLLVLFVSGLLSRDLTAGVSRTPGTVALASATLLVCAFAVLRRPANKTDALQARSLGLKFGVAAGCLWILFLMDGSAWAFVAILPMIAGALGAIGYGKVRGGTLAGFWCGVAGGLIGFLAFATVGNLAILLPDQFPHVDNEIGGAGLGMVLMFYGLIYCSVVGTLGGLVGILLERTGRPSAGKAHAALGLLAIVTLALLGLLFRK
jgi:hypothetical protein